MWVVQIVVLDFAGKGDSLEPASSLPCDPGTNISPLANPDPTLQLSPAKLLHDLIEDQNGRNNPRSSHLLSLLVTIFNG